MKKPMTQLGWPVILCLLIVCGSVGFKYFLEFDDFKVIEDIPEKHYGSLTTLLFPVTIAENGVHTRWTTTGMVLVTYLNRHITGSPKRTLFLLDAVLIIVAFWSSWSAFRSRIFSVTLAVAMGFGTQFHYAYTYTSCLTYYLLCTYLLLNLLAYYKLAGGDQRLRWKSLFVVSLVFTALCWETWLDYFIFLLASSALLFFLGRKFKSSSWRRVAVFTAITAIAVVIPYLYIRMSAAKNFVQPGNEAELIVTYKYRVMAIEDFVYNVVTYIYISFENYFPPCLVSSNSLRLYGAEALVAEQHGYHAELSHLVPMHHVFLWQFNAGIVFTCFIGLMVSRFLKTLKTGRRSCLIACSLCLLILTGFAAHSIIKFHPALSMPACDYKCTISILGVAILLSFGLMTLAKRPGCLSKITVAFTLMILIYGGFTRPAMLQHQHSIIGGVGPPDPLRHFSH